MRVLSVQYGADTGGCGWSLSQAFRGHPSVNLRSTVRSANYLRYPQDMPWSEVESAWRDTDVAHFHNTLRARRALGGDKPFVLHHHGTKYRRNADLLNRAVSELGGTAVVSTLDLLDYGDDLTWVPQAHDLPALAAHRKPQRGRLRIGHAPTDRTIKSTDAFLAACARLDVEPVLIERRSWADCLALKGTCDVLFDQVILGYGNNAIEAWGMGIPVIAGAAPSTLARMRDTFGTLPFFATDEGHIADAIAAMIDTPTRYEYAALGAAHAARWHDGTETVARLERIYRAQAERA